MVKNGFRLLSVVGVVIFLASGGNAQTYRDFKFEKWTFLSEVLQVEKFQPGSVGVIVKKTKNYTIPTTFSLETPKEHRYQVTPDFERVQNQWLKDHPRSFVIPIHHYPFFISQGMNHWREAFVWIIDSGDILNVELVRNGACPASTMLLNPENEPYILIPRYVYDELKKRLLDAEEKAKADGSGIWKTK